MTDDRLEPGRLAHDFVGPAADQVDDPGLDGDSPERPGEAAGRRRSVAAWVTFACLASLGAGVAGGLWAAGPRMVPGPTVEVPGPTVTVTELQIEVRPRPSNVSEDDVLDGSWLIPREAAPGTYQGAPTVQGQACFWSRTGRDRAGKEVILEQVITTGPTIVTIATSDVRFNSQGCRWFRQV